MLTQRTGLCSCSCPCWRTVVHKFSAFVPAARRAAFQVSSFPLCSRPTAAAMKEANSQPKRARDGVANTRAAGQRPPALPCNMMQEFMQKGARMTRAAHHVWDQFVRPGDTVIDATCGNGNDTIHLARLVGPEGHVYAFDIQRDAIHSARYVVTNGLPEEQLPELRFLQACHSSMQGHVHKPVRLVCFNLGYFPGGDRALITRPETTVVAVQAAMALLQEGGLISLLIYIGHSGGKEECEQVLQLLSSLPSHEWTISMHDFMNRPHAPKLVLIYKPILDRAC